jgi:hypothetical protein
MTLQFVVATLVALIAKMLLKWLLQAVPLFPPLCTGVKNTTVGGFCSAIASGGSG